MFLFYFSNEFFLVDVQPSPYCVYQFFDYGDHDSIILHNTNSPQFNDHHTYPVAMTTVLDQYLRSSVSICNSF